MKNFKSFSEFLSNKEVYEYLNILNDIFIDLIDNSLRTHIYYNQILSSAQEINTIEIESISLEKTLIFSISNIDEDIYPFFSVELTFGKENRMDMIDQCLELVKRIELDGLKLIRNKDYSNICGIFKDKWFAVGISNIQAVGISEESKFKIMNSQSIEIELRFRLD